MFSRDFVFDFRNFCCRDGVIGVLIGEANKETDKGGHKGNRRQPKDVPDHAKAKKKTESPDVEAHGSIFRHMDIFKRMLILAFRLLHFPKCVARMHMGQPSKIEKRW